MPPKVVRVSIELLMAALNNFKESLIESREIQKTYEEEAKSKNFKTAKAYLQEYFDIEFFSFINNCKSNPDLAKKQIEDNTWLAQHICPTPEIINNFKLFASPIVEYYYDTKHESHYQSMPSQDETETTNSNPISEEYAATNISYSKTTQLTPQDGPILSLTKQSSSVLRSSTANPQKSLNGVNNKEGDGYIKFLMRKNGTESQTTTLQSNGNIPSNVTTPSNSSSSISSVHSGNFSNRNLNASNTQEPTSSISNNSGKVHPLWLTTSSSKSQTTPPSAPQKQLTPLDLAKKTRVPPPPPITRSNSQGNEIKRNGDKTTPLLSRSTVIPSSTQSLRNDSFSMRNSLPENELNNAILDLSSSQELPSKDTRNERSNSFLAMFKKKKSQEKLIPSVSQQPPANNNDIKPNEDPKSNDNNKKKKSSRSTLNG